MCSAETTWPEVELLLMRSAQSRVPLDGPERADRVGGDLPPLHLLINPSGLPTELQFRLIQQVHAMEDNTERRPMSLVIIVHAGAESHVVGQFKCEQAAPMLKPKVEKEIIQRMSRATRVNTVHSRQPGQGKTDHIRLEAEASGRRLRSLPLNGEVDRRLVIARLNDLDLAEHDALHLDVSNVRDVADLNLLLFELLVIGSLSARGVMFHLPEIPVFIEIANTLQDRLLQGLSLHKLYVTYPSSHCPESHVARSLLWARSSCGKLQCVYGCKLLACHFCAYVSFVMHYYAKG